jgi:uncharacterized protein UU035
MEKEFLETLKESFKIYLSTSPRSNEKLKVIHGKIAKDIAFLLNDFNQNNPNKEREIYKISSLGYSDNREEKIQGRYMDKMVDITISKNGNPVAGIGVKYVMSNYKQNSNNYFENMLGETANIRSNNIPYFQIIIFLEEIPYYLNNGEICKWEKIDYHNIEKYIRLSKDNTKIFLHTPDKTLICLINYPVNNGLLDREEYNKYYLDNFKNYDFNYVHKNWDFNESVIFNDYSLFLKKLIHNILSQ